MITFILLAITLFISLMYIDALIEDIITKTNSNVTIRRICAIVLPILWSLFFYLIHIQ